MHDHLQKLLAQKLGPDARHIITAERARQSVVEKSKAWANDHHRQDEIAAHLSEVGKSTDELELLVEYRELYAAVMADLLIVKDNLVNLEKQLRPNVEGQFKEQLEDEIQELE